MKSLGHMSIAFKHLSARLNFDNECDVARKSSITQE